MNTARRAAYATALLRVSLGEMFVAHNMPRSEFVRGG